jgi:hypothetical protein
MKKLRPIFLLQILGNVLLVVGIVIIKKNWVAGLSILAVSITLNMIFIFGFMRRSAASKQADNNNNQPT